MKYLQLIILLSIMSCSNKFKVEKTIEATPELTKTQLLLNKIYARCQEYIFPAQLQELSEGQKKWLEATDDECRSAKNTVECLRPIMNERLEKLEANCDLRQNKEFVEKNKANTVYRYRALCGDTPCGGVEGKMQIWEMTPNFIFIRATTKVRGSMCKCELNGIKNNEGYFIKFNQPSSQCDGRMVPGKEANINIDIDSCGYCCSTGGGLRGEWKEVLSNK